MCHIKFGCTGTMEGVGLVGLQLHHFFAPLPQSNSMILFLFSIFNMKKLFSIVSPPTLLRGPCCRNHDLGNRAGPPRENKNFYKGISGMKLQDKVSRVRKQVNQSNDIHDILLYRTVPAARSRKVTTYHVQHKLSC